MSRVIAARTTGSSSTARMVGLLMGQRSSALREERAKGWRTATEDTPTPQDSDHIRYRWEFAQTSGVRAAGGEPGAVGGGGGRSGSCYWLAVITWGATL